MRCRRSCPETASSVAEARSCYPGPTSRTGPGQPRSQEQNYALAAVDFGCTAAASRGLGKRRTAADWHQIGFRGVAPGFRLVSGRAGNWGSVAARIGRRD